MACDPHFSGLLTVDEAMAIIDAEPVRPRVETVSLEKSLGRRLAEPIIADRDHPPFDKSLMDGYAVRSGDASGGEWNLELIGEIAAGQTAAAALGAGQAMAIMTGAPLPEGADGVVPVESRIGTEGPHVRLAPVKQPSRYISQRGADARAGATLLETGALIGPAQIAVAASVGRSIVQVYAPPRVAVLGTGDEIVPVDRSPGGAQIRNSNSPMLVALLARLGCNVTDLGVVPDQRQAVQEGLENGLAFDILFVTGGMSMGQYDFVPMSLVELGVKLKVTKLKIKPGKPFVFGESAEGRHVFGLPGNPISAFVCTLRLASRLLARLNGGPAEPAWRWGALTTDLPANGPREFYQPARFDGQTVTPLAWKGSADLFTLARANVLLVRPENAPVAPRGQAVRLLEIPS